MGSANSSREGDARNPEVISNIVPAEGMTEAELDRMAAPIGLDLGSIHEGVT